MRPPTGCENDMSCRENIISEIISRYACCPYPAPKTARRGKPHTTVDLSGLSDEDKRLRDEFYMSCALELARASAEFGEVPVGALVVRGSDIIAADFNGRESEKNALYHAETAVIGKACEALGGWRLPGCELFVTLEPCIMCAGAIVSSRMPRVVFAADDAKAGFFGSVADVNALPLNHKPNVTQGVLADESIRLLSEFFKAKRG